MDFAFKNLNINFITSCVYLIIFSLFMNRFYLGKIRPILGKILSDETDYTKIETKYVVKNFLILFGVLFSSFLFMEYFIEDNLFTSIEAVKSIVFGFSVASFLIISILDYKEGEVYMFEIEIANTLGLFILPIIVTRIFGCGITSKYLFYSFLAYMVLKTINYFLNKEKSIGGADIDIILALILANIAIFLSIAERELMPIFMHSFQFEIIMNSIILNFSLVFFVYFFIYLKRKKETKKLMDDVSEETNIEERSGKLKIKENNFRCLPCFVLIYFSTLFFIFYY